MELLLIWILNAVALLIVAYLLPGITVASFWSALIAALVLGLLNALVKPVLILLTLPITIVTLGLFLLDAKEDAVLRRTLERPVLGVGEDAVLVSIAL